MRAIDVTVRRFYTLFLAWLISTRAGGVCCKDHAPTSRPRPTPPCLGHDHGRSPRHHRTGGRSSRGSSLSRVASSSASASTSRSRTRASSRGSRSVHLVPSCTSFLRAPRSFVRASFRRQRRRGGGRLIAWWC